MQTKCLGNWSKQRNLMNGKCFSLSSSLLLFGIEKKKQEISFLARWPALQMEQFRVEAKSNNSTEQQIKLV